MYAQKPKVILSMYAQKMKVYTTAVLIERFSEELADKIKHLHAFK